MKKLGMIGGASALLILGIVLGAFFAGPLLASANSQAATTTTTTKATTPSSKLDDATKYCNLYMDSLAKQLNTTSDKLRKAQQGAAEDVLAQLVKDGKITQDQANQIKAKLGDAVKCNLKDLTKGLNPGGGKANMQNMQKYLIVAATDVAKGLHLSVTDLEAKIQSGQSLSAIAKAQGVSDTQLQALVKSAVQDALKQAVAAGDLTQAQADQFSQQLTSNPQALEKLLNHSGGKGQMAGMGF